MSAKNWVLAQPAPEEWTAQLPDIPAIIRQLLWNRNIRDRDAVEHFLNPSYKKDLHDPFLFRDMEKAVLRIFTAIENKEKIFVYGDYDADGVTGSVIIKSALDAMGAITEAYLPHREKEGYGLNRSAVSYMRSAGGRLVITNDCGISNASEIEEAQSKGMEVIITDHHRIPDVVPNSFAILHPLLPGEPYPNKFLTGGGVAFKLACALMQRAREIPTAHNAPQPPLTLRGGDGLEGFEKWLLDLVAISTVADVGILQGENRALVKYGLIVMNKTRRPGLRALIEAAGLKTGTLDTWNIGWQIAPRINAAGRMDHANVAFALLSVQDTEEARRLAEQLNQANRQRQVETERVLAEARDQIGSGEGQYLLAAYHPDWNAGIVGLVAGRLTDKYQRPVIVGCKNESGHLVGSARSIDQFNIVEAFSQAREQLLKFGGHPKAAGFSVKNEEQWDALIGRLQELARAQLHEVDVSPALHVDIDLSLAEINWELVNAVVALEPYGEGNPRPRFLIHGISVVGFNAVGNGGKHLCLTATDESRAARKLIGFNCGDWCQKLTVGDLIDVVVEVGVNEWNGNRDIELKIIDLRFYKT